MAKGRITKRAVDAVKPGAMLDKGDLDGCAVWKRILLAVEELRGAAPKPGEAAA